MKRTAFYFCLVLGISISIFACKKKTVTPDDEPTLVIHTLEGQWEETPIQTYRRRIIFSRDGKFIMTTLFMKTATNDVSYSLAMEGNYMVTGNSLKVTVVQEITKEGTAPAIVTDVNREIFEKATFSIEGNVLTLKYISYPADAPVETELKFIYKVMPG
ncbi:hypothetical protein [Pedobacter metabolipauper]|uniref:Lipocalin-like protein n=1 Tax=Pedobacter metabolipauper TaxID=425513 RepID=A0A4R6SX08_9SPHI|nr:hypothetical protein [Pedobacter metabolipauper]TDQ09693.1 hypothetical protein ATK78_1850 [Pedobacter metabolipauper]